MQTVERIEALERRMDEWEARLVAAPAANGESTAKTAANPPFGASERAAPRAVPPSASLEQLVGGRVLAWLGGAAVLAGLAFLYALGVSSGALGEAERVLLGALAAALLVAGGAYLHERRGRTVAAMAATGAGLAGLFLAVAWASHAYDLLPALLGAALAAAVGAFGVALAVRWDAQPVGGLGLLGAALSPALAGTGDEAAGMVLLWLAGAAGVAVIVARRWDWMALALALVVTPQWLTFAGPYDGGVGGALLLLVAFGALGVTAAIGHDLRLPARATPLRSVPTFLLAGTALVLGLAGYVLLDDVDGRATAIAWVAALAAAHIGGGLAARRSARVSADLALLVLALGTALADVAFALALDGAPRAIGWAASAVGFGWLAQRLAGRDTHVATAGLGLHVGLALLATATDVRSAMDDGALDLAAATTLAVLAAAALASARLAPAIRLPLDVLGLGALAVLAALTLDGVALTIAWSVEAAALGVLASRTRDELTGLAAIVHLAGAAVWCVVDQASPFGPLAELGPAALGLGAIALAAARVARLAPAPASRVLAGAAALAALHLASLAAVHARGEEVLSGLWAAVGVAALLVGLRRDVRDVRIAALALLGTAAGKLFVVDLATLEAAYRVGACIAVGLLLLLAAFLHARLRPEPLPDLRAVRR